MQNINHTLRQKERDVPLVGRDIGRKERYIQGMTAMVP